MHLFACVWERMFTNAFGYITYYGAKYNNHKDQHEENYKLYINKSNAKSCNVGSGQVPTQKTREL